MRKILVIEDEPVSRALIAKTLNEAGYQTVESESGRKGWECLFVERDFDAVITDFQMPDLDGRELVLLLRGHRDFTEMPVLLISGVVDELGLGAVMQLPGVAFAKKPVAPQTLLKHLAELIKK